MKINESHWKSMKFNEIQWKSMKICEIQWKSMKINPLTGTPKKSRFWRPVFLLRICLLCFKAINYFELKGDQVPFGHRNSRKYTSKIVFLIPFVFLLTFAICFLYFSNFSGVPADRGFINLRGLLIKINFERGLLL